MPASLPGSTLAQNTANPSVGMPVMFDLLSGPKGSPKDVDMTGNASTGALSTGIGMGPNMDIFGFNPGPFNGNSSNLMLNYIPGVTKPDGTASADSTIMYIGGGRCNAVSNGTATVSPYTAGFGIGMAGNGGARDGGAGPAFTGFTGKVVTATADVASGANIVTGPPAFANISGVTLKNGFSQIGVTTTASAAVA